MDWMIWAFCVLIYQLSLFPAALSLNSFITLDERDSSCRGNFINVENGNFTSHNDTGSNYPVTTKCGWLIESSADEALIITSFNYFNVAKNLRCDRFDIVQVYKGEGTEWKNISPNEGYCGELDPFTIAAKAKRVYITFKSDDILKGNERGFAVSFFIKKTKVKPEISGIGRVDGNVTEVVTAVEQELITIQCYKSGIPNPTVSWWKIVNGTEEDIRPGLIKTIISNGSIQFHHITLSDEGIYRCNATNKVGAASETFQLVVKEKCLCPKQIKVFWYDYPPYTRYETTHCTTEVEKCLHGILYNVVNDMIRDVCGKCEKGHNESVVIWDDVDYTHKKLSDVQKQISNGTTYDIYLPIEGGKDDTKYRLTYNFLPIVESPGVAFMVVGEKEGSASEAVLNSILDGWPILVMTIVMAFLSGIIIWMLDTYWNEEQFPRSLRDGVTEGFWWAFVTMTTVGYGDIAPRGVPGRIFAIVWILCGLVIIAIFTSVVTTSLTVVTLSTKREIYGSVVGAISDSAEYRLGVIKNAEMKGYSSFTDLRQDMDKRKINGCLIDSYVAAYYSDKFQRFRVNNVLSSKKAYGIVLGRRLSTREITHNLTKWIDSHKANITDMIKESTSTLKEPSGSAAMDKSAELFDPNSPIFQNSIVGTVIILVILTVGGLMFEYGYLRPRHRMIESAKNLEMVESPELKEMAYRAKRLKEILLSQVSEFHERWLARLTNLKIKHEGEITLFLNDKEKEVPKRKNPSKSQVDCQSHTSGDEIVGLDGLDTVDRLYSIPDGTTTTIGL